MKILLSKFPITIWLLAMISLASCEKENLNTITTSEDEVEVEVDLVNTTTECEDKFDVEGGSIDYTTDAEAIKFEFTENIVYMVYSVDYDFFDAETAADKLNIATDGIPGVVFGKSEPVEVGDVLEILDFPLLQDWNLDWKLFFLNGTVTISEVGNAVGESIGGTIAAEFTESNGNTSTLLGAFCVEIVEVSQ